ncbi:hypothetical protein [Actinoplanes teichomyceticus]|uniref:Uncharacterized protein n=1 Tax=Actinoplanes teichomyceticus TaxID=1867 RepID=A0A561WB10_ACTTI|nr:hypothetical protein [Actinoplanes teichomyceticus]TWG21057.1 hypothetical protein FHX34_103587 [Actinoplanes teichomyceticus]GIF14877.1 hypothetical protein Ate01nite_49090 [Actinoplanes teichomyceticus]
MSWLILDRSSPGTMIGIDGRGIVERTETPGTADSATITGGATITESAGITDSARSPETAGSPESTGSVQTPGSPETIGSPGTAEAGAPPPGIAETVAEWEEPAGRGGWAVEDWQPEPEIVAYAGLGAWEAVLARVGRHAQLGVRRGGGRPDWHGISKSPADMNRGMVGATLLAPRRLAEVTACTSRDDFTGVQVRGAQRVQQMVVPRIVEHPPGEELEPSMIRGVVTGTAAQAPAAPLDLPEELTAELLRRLRRRPVDTVRIAVGLRVAETWRLPDGYELPLVYDVAPGRSQGYVLDESTGEPLTEVQTCREHHVTGRLDWCVYCLNPTCAACPAAVRPCRLCQGTVCGDCVAPDGRCPACSGLAKVGVFGRGRFGVSPGGAVWHNAVPNVQVTVRQERDWWTLERWDRYDRVTFPLDVHTVQALKGWLGVR